MCLKKVRCFIAERRKGVKVLCVYVFVDIAHFRMVRVIRFLAKWYDLQMRG